MSMNGSCLVCDSAVALAADALKAEIVACSACGQEHEVLDVAPEVKLGLAPEVEEDWGE